MGENQPKDQTVIPKKRRKTGKPVDKIISD